MIPSIPSSIDRDAILQQLERVLSSDAFRRSERSSALLRFVVEQTLNGHADQLKEYTVGVEALGRGSSFDPRTDPVVRAEASRLRDRLERYYDGDGSTDSILLTLPKGSYVPRFELRTEPHLTTSDGSSATRPAAETAAPRRRAPMLQLAALTGGVMVLAIAVVAVTLRSRTAASNVAQIAQFEVELRTDATLGSEVGPDVVLSADGTRLVFAARDSEGHVSLFTRRLDQPAVSRLPGTEGGRVPFLSPDGRWVGFWADGKLKRTPVDGGSPVVLCEATDILGASWGEDGQIIAALNPTGKLWSIPENGGTPRAVVDLTPVSMTPQWPQLLPGGHVVVYAAQTGAGADRANVEAIRLPGGERKILIRGGSFPQYLSNGYLTYVNQGTLYAVPFDARRLEVRGDAIPVLEDVAYSRTFGYAHVGIAPTGTLVYRRSAGGGLVVVAMVDRTGHSTPVAEIPGRYNWARLAPDGHRAAVTNVESGSTSLWIVTVRDQTSRRIAGISVEPSGLTWWPDSRRLIIGSRSGMSWIDVERSDPPRRMSTSSNIQVPWSLAPGGRRLAYYELDPKTGFDLWTVSVVATDSGLALGRPEEFVRTSAYEVYPTFSPDGRWIAYSSNESGRYEIYVRSFPASGAPVRVSAQGGRIPAWSANGSELLFQTDAQGLMAAGYRIDRGTFVASAPRPWTALTLGDAGVLPSFAAAPDAERVIALLPAGRPEDRQSTNHVTVVLNFQEEVRQKLTARAP